MDAVIGDPPLSILERGDRQSEFEFQSIFGMKVSPTPPLLRRMISSWPLIASTTLVVENDLRMYSDT